MSSAAASTSKPEDPAKTTESPKEGEQVPHLSVLEEDDEFEEFAVQGEQRRKPPHPRGTLAFLSNADWAILTSSDWDDSQTDLAHLGGVAPGVAKSEGDKLWEDNWDDDDIEEEFSVQLR
jgi:26 proteasome complex subunit DSS1